MYTEHRDGEVGKDWTAYIEKEINGTTRTESIELGR